MKKSAALSALGLISMLTLAGCAVVQQQLGRFGIGSTTTSTSEVNLATATKVTVEKSTLETKVVANGKVIARNVGIVAFPKAGQVVTLAVKLGDQVKAGQFLAQQDTADLEFTAKQSYASYLSTLATYSQTVKAADSRDIDTAKSQLASAQAALADLQKDPSTNDVASARANLLNAQNTLKLKQDAARGVSQEIASAKAQLDNATIALRSAQAAAAGNDTSVASALGTLQNAEATLKVNQAAYDRAYKTNPAGIGGSPAGLNLEKATNDYNVAKANYQKALDNSKVSLEKANTDYNLAQGNYQRALDNSKTDLTRAQNDVSVAQANYNKLFEKAKLGQIASAEAQVASAQAKLDQLLTPNNSESVASAKAKLEQAEISWQQADANLKKTAVYAPFDGVITTLNFDIGDFMNGGQKAMEVVALDRPLFEIDVDEADIANIRVGQQSRVLLQAYSNRPITATVEYIAPAATTSGNINTVKVRLAIGVSGRPQGITGQGGQGGQGRPAAQGQAGTPAASAAATPAVEGTPQDSGTAAPGQGRPAGQGAQGRPITGTFNAAQVPNIIIGMTGTSEVITSQIENALSVANRALIPNRTTRGFEVIRVLPDGKSTQRVAVTTGFRSQNSTQVLSGVNEGDTLVILQTTPTTTGGAAGFPGAGGGGGAPGGAGGGAAPANTGR
ncbi:MAG: efflux RND transporter periplasmic adaptor subunit [Chloroflexota bacterium]|jgi:HlyD family secretion protein|nr:efflux RND transporter periplasmic adaptor subunit [Chloroflexota bacterium]